MIELKGPLYDRLKFLAQVVLPALGALYFGLAGIWGLPSGEEVVGSIVVIDTFLGVILHLSSTSFAKTADGAIKVIDNPSGGTKTYSLELEKDPEEIDKKEEVRFKVVKS